MCGLVSVVCEATSGVRVVGQVSMVIPQSWLFWLQSRKGQSSLYPEQIHWEEDFDPLFSVTIGTQPQGNIINQWEALCRGTIFRSAGFLRHGISSHCTKRTTRPWACETPCLLSSNDWRNIQHGEFYYFKCDPRTHLLGACQEYGLLGIPSDFEGGFTH